jgi:transposase
MVNEGKNGRSLYYSATDIQELLDVSRSVAYKLLKQMNEELAVQGYIVIPGKVPKKFFAEHVYGMAE